MIDRRRFLSLCASVGISSTAFVDSLANVAEAQVSQTDSSRDDFPEITDEMIVQAAAMVGLSFPPEQRVMMLESVRGQRNKIKAIRALHIPNSVAPALVFDPRPNGFKMPVNSGEGVEDLPLNNRLVCSEKLNDDRLAFASVMELHAQLRCRKITSLELTKLYIARLKKYDPLLHFVVTLTEERALAQAEQADKEIAAGKFRGPLHGIPWGAKDLLSVKGYPTTWGAGGMEDQRFDEDATVVKRLDEAGAVLIAKLTLGALASGDVWFGGRTRNPWNPKQGSSGSSAGSASAVAAGCVGFAIGSETWGSISSPSTRCGTTGLRPTFGLVPRTGAMALSWSMDKLGPITRSVGDAELVLRTIAGADGLDLSVRSDAHVGRASESELKSLRVGYLADAFELKPFEEPKPPINAKTQEIEKARTDARSDYERRLYDNKYDRAALDALRKMGIDLKPVNLPDMPWYSIIPVLEAEAAAAFDELTRTGRDALLTAQAKDDWPNLFRTARLYSAVDYIQAQRARTIAIQKMNDLFKQVDVIVCPSGGVQSAATNLTGHPAVIVPNGIRGNDAPLPPKQGDGDEENVGGPGTPVSITFLGSLYDDARLAALASWYQHETGHHVKHPSLALDRSPSYASTR